MSQFILACLLVDSVLCASTMLTRQGVFLFCFCVYGSRHCMCLFGSGSRNGSSRHVTVCIACISPESSKIVTFSAKKSLGCYHHRDILRFPAILVEKSDDFCYNRDEKRPKRRVSRVLSHPQVVGNAITSTIATLHRHKKG